MKTIKIKLKEKEFEVEGDVSLITNNLEFLGFASVTDRITGKKTVFTSESLLYMEELD